MTDFIDVDFYIQVRLDKVTYRVGRHALPSSVVENWFFSALVKDGKISVVAEDGKQLKKNKAPKKPKKKANKNGHTTI
jgi:hypothetical protein